MTDVLDTAITNRAVYRGPSAQAWFAVGERVGYDPKTRAIVAAQLAMTVTRMPIRNANEIERAIDTFAAEPNGALLMTGVFPPTAIFAAILRLATSVEIA